MARYCKNYTGVLTTFQEGNELMVRVRCKQWKCPYCASVNQKMWRAFLFKRIGEIGEDGWFFITITAHKKAQKSGKREIIAKYSLMNLQEGLNRAFKRFKRQFGNFSYVRVYEQHKSGAFHAHIIARLGELPERLYKHKVRGKTAYSQEEPEGKHTKILIATYFKNTCVECGMGYIVDVKRISDINAGKILSYVLKYMTKNALGSDEFSGIRRIQTSQDFGKNTPERGDLDWLRSEFIDIGDLRFFTVYDLNEKRQIEPDDFDENGHYPPDITE